MIPELGIAIFARTPESGGKNRLASDWGRVNTDIFYLHCLRCARSWMDKADGAAVYWALTGKKRSGDPLWNNTRIIKQKGNGLGERMANVVACLAADHKYWCIIGTDIPQMPPFGSLGLQDRLLHSDILLAPTIDGGFWLVAGNTLLKQSVWLDTPYSQTDSFIHFKRNLQTAHPSFVIDSKFEKMNDVDYQTDLAMVVESLTTQPQLTHAQHQLLLWLQATL